MKQKIISKELFQLTKFVFSYAWPYKWLWIALIFLSFLLIAFGLADPLILKFLVDEVLVNGNYFILWAVMVFFLAFKVLAIAATYTFSLGYTQFMQRVFVDIRNDIFEHLQYKRMSYFNKKEVGGLMHALITDIQQMIQILRVGEGLVTNFIRLIIILVIIFSFDWRLSLMGLVAIPIYALIQFFYINKINQQAFKFIQSDVTLFNFFEERLSNILLVKLFSNEAREIRKSRSLGKKQSNEMIQLTAVTLGMTSLIGLTSALAVLLALWIGSVAVIKGAMTLGALLAIYTYIGQLFSPIASIISTPSTVQSAQVAGNRVLEIMGAPEEISSKGGNLKLVRLKGKIEFKNVGFAYPDRPKKPIFKDLNLSIEPGESVGIVGASGIGKTTLIRLLLRFFDAQKGIIYVDDIALNTLDRHSLRQHIGVVPQDNLFFPGSIKENISYSTRVVSEDKILEATKSTNIHDQILGLTQGYETLLGPSGKPLSDGERQRLSIARVIIKNPDLFVFDEATSDVDPESESIIRKSLRDLSKGRTSIVIAHRFSTLKYVDRIVVLKDGKVQEEGSYKKLMAKKGEFYRLKRLQDEGKYY